MFDENSAAFGPKLSDARIIVFSDAPTRHLALHPLLSISFYLIYGFLPSHNWSIESPSRGTAEPICPFKIDPESQTLDR